jgi:hypothetical protein
MPRPSKSRKQRLNALSHVKKPRGRKKLAPAPESDSDSIVEGGIEYREVVQKGGEEQPEDGFRGPRGGTSRWTKWRVEKKQRKPESGPEPEQARVSGLAGSKLHPQAGRPNLSTMSDPDPADMPSGRSTLETAKESLSGWSQVPNSEKRQLMQDGALCEPVLNEKELMVRIIT